MRKTIKRAAAFAAVLALVLFAGACNIGYVNETTFINRVTETAVKAGVKIEIGYGIRGGILDTEEVYQGSGVIYAQNESRNISRSRTTTSCRRQTACSKPTFP